ncbi:SfnB family sulfur acquisition oxidoreductase [Williamsia sp. M5A3_1d]
MTASVAARIETHTQAVDSARCLAARFGPGAAERDRERQLPHAEIEALSASGLLAITVPSSFGGPDLPPSTVAEVVRILAAADPNVAQIPHSHFTNLNLLRLAGTDEQKARHFSHVLAGGRVANAQAERATAFADGVDTRITRDGAVFRLDGEKFYCTGTLFATRLAVLARLDEADGDHKPGEYVVFVSPEAEGVELVDDWNGIGQRTTGSGTARFTSVAVAADDLVPRTPAVEVPAGYGAFSQLIHAAIDTGIAAGALYAAVDFVRNESRPWFEAGVDNAIDDPLLVQRFGELSVLVSTAEATLDAAARAVDATITSSDDPRLLAAEASTAVATAKIVSDRAATEVSSALFEVSGTRSAVDELNLSHFWRNARTHTLHDPVRWKYQHIGRFVLRGTPPPLHATV